MQEDIIIEREEIELAVSAAREAEALKIHRMLLKAIKDSKNIEQFSAELDAYIERLLTAGK